MKDQSQLVRGILEGCILKIIKEGETYGYEIVESLRTYGFSEMNEGTVYPLLIRIEKNGWVTHIKRESLQGPKRKYFCLTDSGQQELKTFMANWNWIQKTVNHIFNPEEEAKKDVDFK